MKILKLLLLITVFSFFSLVSSCTAGSDRELAIHVYEEIDGGYHSWQEDNWYDYRDSDTATISSGSASIKTGTDGNATFSSNDTVALPGEKILLKIEKTGYKTAYMYVTLPEDSDTDDYDQTIKPKEMIKKTDGTSVNLFYEASGANTDENTKVGDLEAVTGVVTILLVKETATNGTEWTNTSFKYATPSE